MLLTTCLTVGFAEKSPSIFINGTQLITENPPVIENDRTLVPLRACFEALNQEVIWNDSDQSIISGNIWLQINNPLAKAGEKNVTLDVPAKLINDRTYVPLRFIAESLGKDVNWNGEEYRVDILDKKTDTDTNPPNTNVTGDTAAAPAAVNLINGTPKAGKFLLGHIYALTVTGDLNAGVTKVEIIVGGQTFNATITGSTFTCDATAPDTATSLEVKAFNNETQSQSVTINF
ncbi:MAG: hypothetical protein A4E55_01274 [Pelotomaculum sp. PtaU1.Bin035]|nr:MAG: hypothetical protein A4E55_01274 [Pelotomaculum sp. PtaU1.Bin035]